MKLFKIRRKRRDGRKVKSAHWYGKVQLAKGSWQKLKLLTDKESSEKELAKRQKEADRRAAGLVNADNSRLRLPIAELKKQYVASMRQERMDDDHIRIAEWMLDKLIERGGWKFYSDVTEASMRKMLDTFDKEGKTASYRNKYIVRAKAFVNWMLPDGERSPLARLKRISEKRAKRTRERRAANASELSRLFALDLPDRRRLAYALAAFSGLRRNEAAALTWGELSLDSTIPFFQFLQKQSVTDKRRDSDAPLRHSTFTGPATGDASNARAASSAGR